jgi:hypothetical protein
MAINLLPVPHYEEVDEDERKGFIYGLCEAMGLDSILILGMDEQEEKMFCTGYASTRGTAEMVMGYLEKAPEVASIMATLKLMEILK